MSQLHDWWDRVSGHALKAAREDWREATLRTRVANLRLISQAERMHDVEAAASALDALEKAMRNGECNKDEPVEPGR